MDTSIAFIGGGNMASCIFSSIVGRMPSLPITVSDPHADKRERFAAHGARVTADNVQAFSAASVVFLAVKPQALPGVLRELAAAQADFSERVLISMAAGCSCDSIISYTGPARLIRIMPNTPARISQGVMAMYCTPQVSPDSRRLARELLEPLGLLVEVDSEELLNVIGVVGGCAPAFVYRFMEAMIAASVSRGLTEQDARGIAQQVVLGAAGMALGSPDQTLAALREAVTSRGGTTYEGLKVMSELDFDGLIEQTVAASMRRTRELEQQFAAQAGRT